MVKKNESCPAVCCSRWFGVLRNDETVGGVMSNSTRFQIECGPLQPLHKPVCHHLDRSLDSLIPENLAHNATRGRIEIDAKEVSVAGICNRQPMVMPKQWLDRPLWLSRHIGEAALD